MSQRPAPARSRPRTTSRRPGLALALLTGWLGAAELAVSDLRLGLDLRPTDFTFTASNELGSVSGEDSFESGLGISLRGLYGFTRPGATGGFLVGGEAVATWHTYAEDGDYRSYGLRAMGGYAHCFNDRWSTHALAFIGMGLGDFELGSNDLFDGFAVDGTYVEYGILAGVDFRLTRNWLLEAEVGWVMAEADMEGDGFEVTLEHEGPTFFLGAIYRFGGLPPTVE